MAYDVAHIVPSLVAAGQGQGNGQGQCQGWQEL